MTINFLGVNDMQIIIGFCFNIQAFVLYSLQYPGIFAWLLAAIPLIIGITIKIKAISV